MLLKRTTYRISIPLISKKRITHFSDTHLTLFDSLSTPEEIETAKKQTKAWEEVRQGFLGSFERHPTKEQSLPPEVHFQNLIAECSLSDFTLLTGDILDLTSPANLRFAEKTLQNLPRFGYVCGNHDRPEGFDANYPTLFSAAKPLQVFDLGDLLLLGIDNGGGSITEQTLEETRLLLAEKKPTLLFLHMPLVTEENRPFFQAGCDDYYLFNKPGAPEINDAFTRLVTDKKSPVCGVMAGHLHFPTHTFLREGLPQFTVAQGISGYYNEYLIGE